MTHIECIADSAIEFESLIQRLDNHVLLEPDKIIYTFLGSSSTEELTFFELRTRVSEVAKVLQEHCQKGDRALIIFNPGFNFIVSFLACLSVGVIAVPLYPSNNKPAKIKLIKHVILDCAPACILTNDEVNDFKQGGLLAEESPCPIILIENLSGVVVKTEHKNNEVANYVAKPNDIAFLQYTSGTTGDPKGVAVNHMNLVSGQQQLQEVSGHTKGSIGVSWLPPYHDMGLIGGLLQPLYVGFRVVLMAPVTFITKPIKWLEAISEYRATTSCAPNFAFELCVKRISHEKAADLDLSSLAVVFNGAESISASVIERFSAHFKASGFNQEAFLPCYGLAEATLIVSGKKGINLISADSEALAQNLVKYNSDNNQSSKIVSCGYPVENLDIAIVDATTSSKSPDGEINEIWVAGPNIATGYWNQQALTNTLFANTLPGSDKRWLRTGDLGFIHDKQLYISGRKKDLIIIRGKNYYPQDIENAVCQAFPELRDSCVAAFSVNIPDPNTAGSSEEQLALVCELERGSLKNLDYEKFCQQLNAWISKSLEIQASYIALIKPATLPKTTSGKIRRYECRNLLLSKNLAFVHHWSNPAVHAAATTSPDKISNAISAADEPNELEMWIKHYLSTMLGTLSLDTSLRFDEMGMDSLGAANFIGDLSEYAGYDMEPNLLKDYQTIPDLARYVSSVIGVKNGLSRLTQDEKHRVMEMLLDAKDNNKFELSDIPPAFFKLEDYPPNQDLVARNQLIAGLGHNPYFAMVDCVNDNHIVKNGNRFINYSSNNFLGMSGHKEVQDEAIKHILDLGTSVSASRLISGEKTIHEKLESGIANFLNTENAMVFVGAATANVSTIGHLFNERDLILYDELSHDSLLQGIKLSHAAARPFKHNDYAALENLLKKLRCRYEKVLIFVEGLYSMDGDIPLLKEFIRCKQEYKCWLMVDECLSIGVLGKTGRGIAEEQSIDPKDVDIWMGGLSKAFASCGGYIAGKRELINYLKYTCPGFVFTTGISPANTAAAWKAISLIAEDHTPVSKLRDNAQLFLTLAKNNGLNTGSCEGYSIIPIIIGDSPTCLTIYQGLIEDGINVQPVLYPAVAENSARFRFSLTALHTEEQIRYTIACLSKRISASIETPLAANEELV